MVAGNVNVEFTEIKLQQAIWPATSKIAFVNLQIVCQQFKNVSFYQFLYRHAPRGTKLLP